MRRLQPASKHSEIHIYMQTNWYVVQNLFHEVTCDISGVTVKIIDRHCMSAKLHASILFIYI